MRMSGILSEKGIHAFDAERHMHAGHIVPCLWIMVVDREKARLYRRVGQRFEQIALAEYRPRHPHDHDEHRMEAEFAEEIVQWLSRAQEESVFDRVILVAAPRLLGAFRSVLSPKVQACVAAEVPKDLTRLNGKALHDALEKIVVL